MKTYRNSRRSGFTLVEILIVVIILGILAAIVIPQFTNASQDARKSSLTSQLQTIRSQVELYKLQHLDQMPAGLNPASAGTVAAATAWAEMINKTDVDHTVNNTSGQFGPYLQANPANPLNQSAGVYVVTADVTPGSAATGVTTEGWICNKSNGKMWSTSAKFGYVYDEANPSNSNNDK